MYGSFDQIGDIVTFGRYEQDNDLTNGAEPIEWIVLDVQNGKSLLISRYALDCQPFNTTQTSVTWDRSTIRTWLNGEFLNDAFNSGSLACIKSTHVSATDGKNPTYNTNPGSSTEDKVFLLSINEARNYFSSNQARQCAPTAYAESQGCHANTDTGTCWWWLRSPGNSGNDAANVNNIGDTYYVGNDVSVSYGVRPVIWVDTEAAEKAQEAAEQMRILFQELSTATVGQIVTFGNYEQDNDLSNGVEPIEWIVLDVQDGKSLLISRYALDCQQYNIQYVNVTWETCSMRKWLNSTFLNNAFNAEEQALIPTVTVSADKNPDYNTTPGNSTEDKIFLLSIEKVNKYFVSNKDAQCVPTVYAKTLGCYVDQNTGTCSWWLRSPGGSSYYAAFVYSVGAVDSIGGYVNYSGNAVRPALWINLSS